MQGTAPQPREPRDPSHPFPDTWVFLDLEVAGERVREIGVTRAGRSLRIERVSAASLARLRDFTAGATMVIGHNVWNHDRRYLKALRGVEELAALPMLDTLPLSVLSMPGRPYHALVKDYKLVRAELSDPVEDCALAARLLAEEAALLRQPDWAQAFGLAALATAGEGGGEAVRAFCAWLGVDVLTVKDAAIGVVRPLRDLVCVAALRAVLTDVVRGAVDPVHVAFALSWLSVAGTGSVLPRWVAEQYPEARRQVHGLRVTCCDAPECRWCRTTNDETAALKKWFGFDGFRAKPAAADGTSLQASIVRNGLAGTPTFAVLPTGGGKSICFQLPALVRAERTGALTVVISPLQSLMKDQVDNLKEQAESAVGQVNGALTLPERARAIAGIRDGRLALVYVSPEQLRNKSVRAALEAREVGAWVFDEAHCLSKWGHDFRTDYLYAPRYIREHATAQGLEVPPVFCFTATAQREVVEEVCAILARETGQTLDRLLGGVERDNLTFEVRAAGPQDKLKVAAELIREHLPEGERGSAVVFAATRKSTEEAAEFLQAQGLPATAYHAGLDGHERRAIQDRFIAAERAVIAATSAFGMGVDKPDVRLVVHLTMPGSLESYLQQAGRAGRDREPAHCVLLTHDDDAETQFRLARRSRLHHADISAILRSVRSAKATSNAGVRRTVVTHVELMQIGSARARFDAEDRFEQTRVNTAVAWLERAELLQRDENVNRVFQGTLRTKTLDEARARLAEQPLSQAKRTQMERVLTTLALAPPDEALSADQIALEAGLWSGGGGEHGTRDGERGTGQTVLELLRDLARLKLLGEHTRYTAFVDHGVQDSTQRRFERLLQMDAALREALQEAAPDADVGATLHADLNAMARQVFERCEVDADPVIQDQLRALWSSYERDGEGLRTAGSSLDLRFRGRGRYRVVPRRELHELGEARGSYLAAAAVVLRRVLADLPPGKSGKSLLVAFDSEALVSALEADLETAPHVRDGEALVQSVLLLLHDARVLTLQNGLAVFRQAMTIHHNERDRRLQFKKADYEPLHDHYERRNTQIHVMAEYARLGVRDMDAARRLAVDWFDLERGALLERWMPDRSAELARSTTQRSYDQIVTSLEHPVQESVVVADPQANQLVLAGPGSGKTRVIVHRIAYLIRVGGFDPAGIVALAYNRSAAYEIRRRLRDLVGAEARFVRVLTLHGLAVELVGRMPDVAGLSSKATDEAFQAIILEAAERLEEGVVDGAGEGGAARERLLAGCSHLLIDEYQDIDASQARLVTALSGRLVDDGRKLAVLAVGDDDQNIYGFRGASPEFIRAFGEQFGAATVHLLDNFRSTTAIVDAANHLIAPAPGRLKASAPIRPAARTLAQPAGGRWAELDVVSRGRVRLVYCDDAQAVGDFVAHELIRLNALDDRTSADDFAVLGRTRNQLFPVREALRTHGILSRWTLGHGKGVPVHAVRELVAVARWLEARRNELVCVRDVIDAHAFLRKPRVHHPWAQLLLRELEAWEDAYGRDEVVAATLALALRDAVADQRRSHAIGSGPTLATLHASKGLEFPHVFVLPGALRADDNDPEAERRLLYVGCTRAEQTLTVVVPRGLDNPFVAHLEQAPDVDRSEWKTLMQVERVSYDLFGLGDFWIDWAGQNDNERVHAALRALEFGSRVRIEPVGSEYVGVFADGRQVAALKTDVAAQWHGATDRVIEAQVLAMVERERWQTTDETYARRLVRDRWEVPIVELRCRE